MDQPQLHTLLRHIDGLVVVQDDAGLITYASPASAALVGVDPAQLLGTPLASWVAERDRAGLDAARRRTLEMGTESTAAVRLPTDRVRDADDDTRWLHCRCNRAPAFGPDATVTVVADAHGEPTGRTLRDLKLRVTQLANQGGELAFPDLAEEVGRRLGWPWAAVFNVDLLGRAAVAWSGLATDDPDLPHGDDIALLDDLVAEPRIEVLSCPSGTRCLVIPIATRARVENLLVFGLTDEEPEPAPAVLAALEDVRAQTQLLLERRRIVRELHRSNVELARFASVASHDLQEPLRKVTGFLSLLADRYADALDETAHEFIDFAVTGATRMQHLINDLLAYARIGQGDSPPSEVDLQALVAELAASFELNGDAVRVGPLPRITGYAPELRQLFDNLLANAVKFAPLDATLHVVVTAQRAAGRWIIEVEDNGIGIPADQLDQVFDPFFRGHPTRRYSGTGIGLGICRKVVEHHGGTITATSTPGVGTTIHVELPGAPP